MAKQVPPCFYEIDRLLRVVEYTTVKYFYIDQLHKLGIEGKQIDLKNDDKLQFDPSFFEPQHHDLHETYPLLDKTEEIRDLTLRANWDRSLRWAVDMIAQRVKERRMSADELKNNGEEELFKLARWQYQLEQEHASEGLVDAFDRSQITLLYMQSLLAAERDHPNDPRTEGDSFHLSDLTPLREGWRTRERKGDPDLICFDHQRHIFWRIENMIEDWEQKDPKPHAVMWNWVEFEAGVHPECLTIHEVQSIVRWFMIRIRRSTWKRHGIQPMLLVSYTGSKDGRIIQAHYDGKKLNLQFSPLYPFEDEETAPIDLFLRYTVATPIGHTRKADESS